MIFDGKLVDEISDSEVASLVANSVQENQHLEYKGTYSIINDKLEILRDISSLANASGGYLIVGINDDGSGGT